MIHLGIDGCRSGWLVVSSESKAQFTCKIHSSLENILLEIPKEHQVLIDVPIGFPQENSRHCDILAREKLGPRRSSVFLPPCRDALYASNDQEACEINLKISGKKISIQTWNIGNKMREADQFLQNHQELLPLWREAHPELAFQNFNNGVSLTFSKKSFEGHLERIKILQNFYHHVDSWIEQKKKSF